MPVGDYKWVENPETCLEWDWAQFDENGDIGYILEVDLEYPSELHDSHASLPLAPFKGVITEDNLSIYAKGELRHIKRVAYFSFIHICSHCRLSPGVERGC